MKEKHLKKESEKKKHDHDEFAGYLHYKLKYNNMKVF